jgi:hypothetical protein
LVAGDYRLANVPFKLIDHGRTPQPSAGNENGFGITTPQAQAGPINVGFG